MLGFSNMGFHTFKGRLYALLRFTERYTRTDMVYLTKGTTWTFLGQAVASASTLALGIAFANLLEKEVYGTYKYILTIASIFSIFTWPGVGTALIQAAARSESHGLTAPTLLRIRGGAWGSLCAIAAAIFYHLADNQLMAISFVLIAAFLPFFDTFAIYTAYLQGKKLFYLRFILFSLTQAIAALAISITLIFTHSLPVLLLAYFGSYTVLRLLCWLYVKAKHATAEEAAEETLRYGKHLSAVKLLSTVTSQADTILVYYFLGPVQVAVYSVALALPQQIAALFQGAAEVIAPKAARKSLGDINSALKLRMLQLACLGLLGSIIYITVSPWVFDLFFPEYIDSLWYSQIFSLTMVFAIPVTFIGTLFQTQPKILKQTYIGTVLPNLTLLVLLVLLTPTLGILGVIYARAGFYATGLFLGISLWRRAARQEKA